MTREEKFADSARREVEYRISFWNSLEGSALRTEIFEWIGRVETLVEEFPYSPSGDGQWRREVISETFNRLVDNALLQLERIK